MSSIQQTSFDVESVKREESVKGSVQQGKQADKQLEYKVHAAAFTLKRSPHKPPVRRLSMKLAITGANQYLATNAGIGDLSSPRSAAQFYATNSPWREQSLKALEEASEALNTPKSEQRVKAPSAFEKKEQPESKQPSPESETKLFNFDSSIFRRRKSAPSFSFASLFRRKSTDKS